MSRKRQLLSDTDAKIHGAPHRPLKRAASSTQ